MQDLLTRLLLAGGGGFSPSALFGGGAVQGAWYDPSDFGTTGTGGVGTLFQDDAGTTPVTAVEQPVGLMLDKSKNGVGTNGSYCWNLSFQTNFASITGAAGQEVPNGTGWSNFFNSGGTRTYVASSVISGAQAMNIAGVTSDRNFIAWSFTPKASTTYTVSFYIESVSGVTGTVSYAEGTLGTGGSSQILSAPTSTGRVSYTFTTGTGPGTVNVRLGIGASANADGSIRISGFQVNEGSTLLSYQPIAATWFATLPGNHAYQSTSASRPTLRARYNLLTYSEQFENAAWAKVGLGAGSAPVVTANAGVAPDGTTTADRVQFNCGGNTLSDRSYVSQNITVLNSTSYRSSFYVKAFSASEVGKQLRFITESLHSAQIITLTNDWQLVSVAGTSSATTVSPLIETRGTITNSATADVLLWGAQLTTPAVFPSNTYQRIADAATYATGTAFPPYLFFDGTDDSMLTNSVDFATVTSDGQARRNLLTLPNQFGVTPWVLDGSSVSLNSAVAPDGTTTASTITGTSGNFRIYQQAASNIGSTYTISVYAKQGTSPTLQIDYVNVDTGPVFTFATASFSVKAGFTTSVQDVGNGWYRLVVTRANLNANPGPGFVVSGATTVFLWNAQYELGSTATAFQNIGTDQMTVFAGVTKNSDAAAGVPVELSATIASNNGAFVIQAPSSVAANNVRFTSKGTTLREADGLAASPITLAITGIGDIGGDVAQLRVNGAVAATNTADQGTGNYGNYPLYIGRRNNASLPFNGNLYSLIVQGATPTSSQLVSTEQWVAAKTPLGSV